MEITIQYITTTTSEMGNILRFLKDGLRRNNDVRLEKDILSVIALYVELQGDLD